MASHAVHWNQRDAHWPALGHEALPAEPPANAVTFAGMVHSEGVRRNGCLQMEILRLRAQCNRAVARADMYESNYDKVVEELAALKKKPENHSRFDGGLARSNRDLSLQLEEMLKSLEGATRRALVAEEMVQHQKNGIDALNADFCALELKYVSLKNEVRKPVMPPLPPPPPHDEHAVVEVGSPEEEGWERVGVPLSEA